MFRFTATILLVATAALWVFVVTLGNAPEDSRSTEAMPLPMPLLSPERVSFLPPPADEIEVPVVRIPWKEAATLSSLAARAPKESCFQVAHGDEILFTHSPPTDSDEPRRLIPASLQKLVTAQAALTAPLVFPKHVPPNGNLTLSLEYTFKTIAFAESPITGGEIDGDLFILGGGDPLLVTPTYAELLASEKEGAPLTHLEELAAQLVDIEGLRRINGSVIAVDSRYDEQTSVNTWPDGWAAAGVTGALNSVAVNQGYAFPGPRNLRGRFAPDENPALTTASIFDDLLEERGVIIPFRPEVAPRNMDFTGFAPLTGALESKPLREILRFMLIESDNTTAELLLKEIGLHLSEVGLTLNADGVRREESSNPESVGAGASAPASSGLTGLIGGSTIFGASEAAQVLHKNFIYVAVPADGSGLSSENALSCSEVIEVLQLPPYGGPEGELASYLPVAFQTGTLQERFPAVAGKVKAKTGTLENRVAALAGFTQGADESWFTFAAIINHDGSVNYSDTEDILGEMLEVLVSASAPS